MEILFKQLQLTEAKVVTTLGTKEEGRTSENIEVMLGDSDATNYRALVARCKYLSPDRQDVAFTVKELARTMSKPMRGGPPPPRLKQSARHLQGKPRLVLQYKWQPTQTMVTTYSDADWAGCREIKKLTTGGCITTGSHCIKGRSKTQVLIAFSPGESELYASSKASAKTLGMIAMLKDFG